MTIVFRKFIEKTEKNHLNAYLYIYKHPDKVFLEMLLIWKKSFLPFQMTNDKRHKLTKNYVLARLYIRENSNENYRIDRDDISIRKQRQEMKRKFQI